MRKLSYKSGFTLIELLVVISIIGFLSSFVATSINETKIKSRNARRILDINQLKTALEFYYNDNGSYPSTVGGVGSWDGIASCWGDATPDWIPNLNPTFIRILPRDPSQSSGCSPNYIYYSNGVNYKLLAHGIEQCEAAAKMAPGMKDPARDGGVSASAVDGNACWAIGVWTSGAVSW